MESSISAVVTEVIRNRMVAITEEMRIALQSVSGSPTVTEASDFFTGIFLPNGSVVSMGFQVALQAPVSGTVIRHIQEKSNLKIRDGDMFIGNDPFIGALHQNDVQMIGPIFASGEIVAWAGVQAHQTDVGGMDFASWCPKAKNVYQEGMRIPCVKLVDQGEIREDVMEMILTASRLPHQLGLDIKAFMATISVARKRIGDLVERYGLKTLTEVMHKMNQSSESRMRNRLRELPDGEFHASDFLEHDGHSNELYKVDVHLTKKGDQLTLDFSGSSKQAPGFINATRAGLAGGVAGAVLPTLAYDMQWNQGALSPIEIVAPDGLICTAQHPAPVGAATVETIWVVANAVMLVLNKLLATSDKYRPRTQGVNDGAMATFNLGGTNQFGEPFGLHLMDPLAGGSAAFASKDGVNAGGPITSPVSAIADVERNEQVSPLYYLYRRLAEDTGGAGKYRGGLGAEIGLSLGGIKNADALIMTHGAEVPNGVGLAGGWPGATIKQSFGRNAVKEGRAVKGDWEEFGPKPGHTPMTNHDVFAVTWQGGGGYGDPIERDIESVVHDVKWGAVSPAAAANIYGVVMHGSSLDENATALLRAEIRKSRVGEFVTSRSSFADGERIGAIGPSLHIVQGERGIHVVSPAGYVLATGNTRWRSSAKAVRMDEVPPEYRIALHEKLAMTAYYCPASGTLLTVDVHLRDETPVDDVVINPDAFKTIPANQVGKKEHVLAGR